MNIKTSSGAIILAMSIIGAPAAQAHHRHMRHTHPYEPVQTFSNETDRPDTTQRVNAYINSEGEYIPSMLEPSAPSDQ